MLEFLGAIWSFIWQQIDAIWLLYTTSSILSAYFALWVIDRIFHIFDVLKR